MHHEQACAMAAEGYARISGKPAVLVLTTGPGSINALNGVFGAFTDSIPMIVISGQIKRETCRSFQGCDELRQLGDQEGPTIDLAKSVCKFAHLVRDEHEIETWLPHAYKMARSGRPGPVWLDIPIDIQNSTVPLTIGDASCESDYDEDVVRSLCKIIIDKLIKSNRPVIIGGTGVRISGATEQLRSLIEHYQLPMATAWTHDLLASDHALHVGRPGTIGTRAGNICVQNADFVLVLGSRLNIRQTSYNFTSFARQAWLAQVDIDPLELNKPTRRPDLGVVADISLFLEMFTAELALSNVPDFRPWIKWCKARGSEFNFDREYPRSEERHLNPYHVVDSIFQKLRSDHIIVCGNASACIIPYQVGQLKMHQRMFSNSGSASMGYDLPAAIGAAIAARSGKDKRVICFAGDGSLQMNIQELQTISTYKLDLAIIVLNNSGYLSIRQTHENFFGKIVGATPETGIEFPDFCAVANAYGIASRKISSQADLRVLDDLLQRRGPVLIDIHVDPQQEFTPRIKSRVDMNGKFLTPELDDMYPFIDQEILDQIRQDAATITAIHQGTC